MLPIHWYIILEAKYHEIHKHSHIKKKIEDCVPGSILVMGI